MARGQAVDSGKSDARRLSLLETAEHIRAFLARWRREGGPTIAAIEDPGLIEEAEDALELLPEIPAWASSAGAIAPRGRNSVLLWLKANPCEKIPAGIQLLFREPRRWASRSVKIHYYVIPSCSGEQKGALLSGLERYGGDPVVLSPPAPGDILIHISESH